MEKGFQFRAKAVGVGAEHGKAEKGMEKGLGKALGNLLKQRKARGKGLEAGFRGSLQSRQQQGGAREGR